MVVASTRFLRKIVNISSEIFLIRQEYQREYQQEYQGEYQRE